VSNVVIEGVGESVVMTRDDARRLGMGLVRIVSFGGDVLDDGAPDAG
jgi:hypothetical protein